MSMSPQDMEAPEKKRSPQAWKLRLPWEQQKQAEMQKSAFIQSQENARASTSSVSTLARAFMISRKRLRLDPDKKLHFLYEPGKQVSSAIKIKNVSRTHVAFKFQTTAPKSCFMRPPSGVLAPNATIIATVVKFLEQPENERPQEKKTKDKFKIVSLAVQPGIDYTPELFEDEKELVTVERILQVVFIDPHKASPELDRLQKRLAEAEAAEAAGTKPAAEMNSKGTMVLEGLVIDEWKQRRENYLARQQGEGGESL
ncbi:vesicle-associated protein 4-2 isoform X2 [Physcomitrium patens]|uniref:MSP domain-containing protein n=1 Tax=Physcomitrium patens TaxID=3218 RepID=A0A7I4BRJ0_PHYPA|nr:vesicle-associated protein 4-2-like isoform X2 [Physcomitrium patens]|eukprot:XP_024402879.1 vesicle-associated protein 4-2-like isoform X2 [Physcomitrella patens]